MTGHESHDLLESKVLKYWKMYLSTILRGGTEARIWSTGRHETLASRDILGAGDCCVKPLAKGEDPSLAMSEPSSASSSLSC